MVAVLVDNSRSMGISDSSGTREDAAKKLLDNGILKTLGEKFQVRLYEFGKEPERIQKADQVNGIRAGVAPGRHAGAGDGGILLTAVGRDRDAFRWRR